ncbi:unnamed protein product [Ostreobium quekettii]|uniref:HP domain-containing protein n=1 Tax=Ostreobium quekettii TaxID=121088 RepID=A0A8S1IS97_9CHLO|nr:unnamed protein product [Ostreobium quekettii]|eukprot:evm.model.scf_1047.1 EVM.evm.TU.scf_1047.1   scf_1047:26395-32368(-)
MWGNFGLDGLAKLGESIGDALQRVLTEVEQWDESLSLAMDPSPIAGRGAEGFPERRGHGSGADLTRHEKVQSIIHEVSMLDTSLSTTQHPKDSVRDLHRRAKSNPGGDMADTGEPLMSDMAAKLMRFIDGSSEAEDEENAGASAAKNQRDAGQTEKGKKAESPGLLLESGPGQRPAKAPPEDVRVSGANDSSSRLAGPTSGGLTGVDPWFEEEADDDWNLGTFGVGSGALSGAAIIPVEEESAETPVAADPPADRASSELADCQPSPVGEFDRVDGCSGGCGGSGLVHAVGDAGHGAGQRSEAAEMQAMHSTLKQLEEQARQMAALRKAQTHLEAKNRELAKCARELEAESEELHREYGERLAAAERKVYALTKERDVLKQRSDKLTIAKEMLKEKDDTLQQVMEEGEMLSKRQVELERALRSRNARVRELEALREKLNTELTREASRCEVLLAERSSSGKGLEGSEADASKDTAPSPVDHLMGGPELKNKCMRFVANTFDSVRQIMGDEALRRILPEDVTMRLEEAAKERAEAIRRIKIEDEHLGWEWMDMDMPMEKLGPSVAGEVAHSYKVLRAGVRWPRNVDPTRREEYLTDEEFAKIFRCSFSEYKEYPQWRQLWLKKERNLF